MTGDGRTTSKGEQLLPGKGVLLHAVFSGAAAEPGRSIRRGALRRRCRGAMPDGALRTVLPGFGTPFMRDAPRHR